MTGSQHNNLNGSNKWEDTIFRLLVCLIALQLYPGGFANVKEKVFAGQFQPVGGAWVEHDGNMPSGESMVRQNLLGQRYFQSRFGVVCDTAWLPDSFGLSGALPQILRLSGMKVRISSRTIELSHLTRHQYFFTQKLSWNNMYD